MFVDLGEGGKGGRFSHFMSLALGQPAMKGKVNLQVLFIVHKPVMKGETETCVVFIHHMFRSLTTQPPPPPLTRFHLYTVYILFFPPRRREYE